MKATPPNSDTRAKGLRLSVCGQEYFLLPITLGAARACLKLEAASGPQDKERARPRVDRLTRQVHTLIGAERVQLTGQMTMAEFAVVVGELFFASMGRPPEDCAARMLAGESGDAIALLARYVALPLEFAATMHPLPAAADCLPLGDALALHGQLAGQSRAGIGLN